ncbi:hypothetical protein BEL01nite_57500 [Bradyrhizobium elkanii]|nr:hypothetical protein BEL01nite_57500 [Bradyrhizobium elkanii]
MPHHYPYQSDAGPFSKTRSRAANVKRCQNRRLACTIRTDKAGARLESNRLIDERTKIPYAN